MYLYYTDVVLLKLNTFTDIILLAQTPTKINTEFKNLKTFLKNVNGKKYWQPLNECLPACATFFLPVF